MPMSPRLLRPKASGRFLLDLHGPALFAFSLRRLRSGYSGPVVRVRTSAAGNAEEDFTADQVASGALAAWVGAGNDGTVRTWYNQSGNGLHLEQSTAANQPTIVSSGALSTDGVSPALLFGGSQQMSVSNSYSADRHHSFAVARNTSTTASARHLWTVGPERVVNRIQTGATGQFYQQSGAGVLNTSASNYYPQNDRVLSSVFANHTLGSISVFRNGASSTSNSGGNTSAVSVTRFAVGASGSGSNLWIGNVTEVVVFDADVSSRRTAIESEINRHYAIY